EGAHLLSVMWDIDGFRHENLDVSPPAGFFRPQVGRNTDIDFAEKNPDVMARVFDGNNTHGAFSSDNGRTWTRFASAPEGKAAGYRRAMPGHAGNVCLASDGGLVGSKDSGASFVKVENVDSAKRVGFGKAATGQSYCATYLIGKIAGKYGFYRSDDLGATWV